MPQVFVLFVPSNAADIVVKAIQRQKIHYVFAGVGLSLLLEYLQKL